MQEHNYPIPLSHKTFELGQVVIDSNFDSGNIFNAEKVNHSTFNLWIAVDHPKNQYRTWFHFSIKGLHRESVVTFNIKNMQNQSRLLYEGLVPVFREESSKDWKRIAHKIDLTKIEFNEGWIQWSFKHTFTSDEKVFFAFFYPWSNTDNDHFLTQMQAKCKTQEDVYFKRSNIIRTLDGRPVDFITITSRKGLSNKAEKFDDQHLFPDGGEPKEFMNDKKCIIISARVHPGQVPSSHVMTGIIAQLTQNSEKARILRDKFVFYIFPILNPDGVGRGHYRVDSNGINLNRCYINPSYKNHPPIYAVKKIIMHFHHKGKYFGFLDLHAHAARKGVFIYGNSTNELDKQVQICLFPKILSMNSQIFEYQGSNFTENNMYCKDRNDHVSKEGAGRVAIFKATKNPYSWTLECNYNSSRVLNVIDEKRSSDASFPKPNENQLDPELLINYKCPTFKQPKQFYTIEHFRTLGKQICESFLDLIEMNPQSRIDSSSSYFKSVQNLRMNLAVALLRMAPNRFESQYKKIYHYLEGPTVNHDLTMRGLKALYFLLVKKAKIQNIGAYLKDNDNSSLILPKPIAHSTNKMNKIIKLPSQIRIKQQSCDNSKSAQTQSSREQLNNIVHPDNLPIMLNDKESDSGDQSQPETQLNNKWEVDQRYNQVQFVTLKAEIAGRQINMSGKYQRGLGKQSDVPSEVIEVMRAYRRSINGLPKRVSMLCSKGPIKEVRVTKASVRELPSLINGCKIQPVVTSNLIKSQLKMIKKNGSLKDDPFFYI